ncbi:unnamed protein product [Ophioblennius macclurei]
MMDAVKPALLLLLLGVVVSEADPDDCGALTSPLLKADLNSIQGHWVLVWSVADLDQELVGKISSSHVEIELLSDNKTVHFHERNVYLSNTSSCTEYTSNMTIISDSENVTLHSDVMKMDKDGVVQEFNETGHLEFFRMGPNSMLVIYKGSTTGRYSLSYRREGFHQDVGEQKATHEQLIKFSECLKFPTDKPFVYDGVADFCHKKSAPEAKPEES